LSRAASRRRSDMIADDVLIKCEMRRNFGAVADEFFLKRRGVLILL
jgi:hypothetical protein